MAPPARIAGLRPDGSLDIERIGATRSWSRDLFHTMMTARWSELIGLGFLLWLAINAIFAGLFMLDPGGVQNARPGSFADHWSFAVQTSATIGYGGMLPVHPMSHALVSILAFVSNLYNACLTGVVVAKFARPTARVMFPENVVIFERGGQRQLQLRLANARGNYISECRVRLTLMRDEVSPDGERMRRLHDLHLVRSETPNFMLSWTVMHDIGPHSPLFGLTEADMEAGAVTLSVTIAGLDETLGQTVHARHFYTWPQFAWDQRYDDILSIGDNGRRIIDFRRFNILKPAKPPPRA